MPTVITQGAASAKGYGFGARSTAANYIEDVFSTYLYTGNGAAQAIGNSIQLGNGATTEGFIKRIITSGQGQGIKVDSSGNIYIAATSSNNIYVTKYNSAGVVQWQRTLSSAGSDSGNSIAVDSSGNVYVCGSSTSGANGSDIQVVKYNSSGTLQWQNILRTVDGDYGAGVSVDSSGNVFITGSSSNGNLFGVVAKLNSSGTLQWQRSIDGGTVDSDSFQAVTADSAGNVYAAGYVISSTREAVLVKYNTSGTASWQRKITTGDNTYIFGVATDSSDNVYVAGYADASKIFVAKFNSSGTSQWINTLTNSSGSTSYLSGIVVDSSGNVYVGGTKNTGALAANGGILVMKFNSSGTLQWQRDITSSVATGTINGGSLALLNNDLYVVGSTIGSSVAAIFAKVPTDGTGLGTYLVNDFSVSYVVSNFTTTTAFTVSTSTFSLGTSSLTYTSSSLTDASVSLTTYTATIPTGTGKGGLVWIKGRSGATDHALYDTARGATFDLASNLGGAQTTQATGLTSFDGTGFSIGALAKINTSAATYASWTFRKQPKFFDIVTYTGNGANRTIAHSLGSVPGCIMVKQLNGTESWTVYQRSLTKSGYGPAQENYIELDKTSSLGTGLTRWNNTSPTSTVFSLGTDSSVNANGGTYVAYLFAHNAGGFGATGADNVISCGSYTGNGSATGPVVTLGYEPQWLLIKRIDDLTTGNWNLIDNMRGFVVGGADAVLNPNLSNAESTGTFVTPTATGFQLNTTNVEYNASGNTYIYIAIRRGPMRTPTTGTSVFSPLTRTGNGTNTVITNPAFPVDLVVSQTRTMDVSDFWNVFTDRLRGGGKYVSSFNTNSEAASNTNAPIGLDSMTGYTVGNGGRLNWTGTTYADWSFRRAPGFFDVVCYTGTGVARTVSHNLGVAPELMIVKGRSGATAWQAYSSALSNTEYLVLNTTAAKATGATRWNSTTPTASVFSLGTASEVNTSTATYVAYLFATVAGVSKVGSYTGSGTTKQINCGFTAGARFVLIKRTDSTGDWYVWDSARGIVAGNDPYLLLNSAAAEVTSTDYIDTYSAGFEISSTAPAAINANGGSFIFLAIA